MKFSDLGLHPLVMAGVEASQFVDCTPIQEATIPHILAGRDIAGLAQTGTGKTAAFVLPLIDRIVRSREANESTVENPNLPLFKEWRKSNFILVLVPTRELAEQVGENVAKFGKNANVFSTAIYGGTGYESQKAAIKKGVEFIVATPGRLIDLYKEHQLDLGQVRAVVFDEADRMFDMGFKDDMKYILRRVPQDRQFLVFSATLNFDVLNTAYEFGANPIEVNVSRDQAKAENVVDEIFHVGIDEKAKFLLSILQKHKPEQVIIFSNFKHNVERIAKFLTNNGVPAMGISSLISQSQRTRIMEQFRTQNNDRNILVATDVAARGLDIKGVDMVINYELPDDAENYVHRIGRTGRAGASGHAYSLVGDRDVEALQRIENYLGHKVNIGWLDDADLVKEFKPFVFDDERKRRDFSSSGPRRDNRDHRGPRDRGHGGGSGGSGHGRPQHPHRQGQGRPHDKQARPGEHKPRHPQAQSGSSHGQQQKHGHQKPRHPQQQNQNRFNGRRQEGRPDHRGPHPQGPRRDFYKHKPTAAAQVVSTKGGWSAVSNFFKKLFGQDKTKSNKQ